MFKNKSVMAVVAIFCMVVACTSFWACSKNEGNAGSGAEVGVSGNTSKKKIKKAKLPTKPSAEEDFVVILTSDGTGAEVTGYVGKGGGVYIPATIQGMPVKRVDMEIPRTAGVTALVVSDGCEYVRVFSDKDAYGERTVLEITNVFLPDSVEVYNLRNTMITEFEVPANAKMVYRLPLTLEKVSFRGVQKEIYKGAFEGSQLTSIVLPEGMEKIQKEAFYNCTKLESINLPANLQEIAYEAFKNCSSLKNVTIPDSLVGKRCTIWRAAFEGCPNLPLTTQAQLKKLGYTWGQF